MTSLGKTWVILHSFSPVFELLDQLGKRSQLFVIDELEFIDKIDKMLETCVQVIFGPKTHHVLEMTVVNMGINTEQSFEDHFDDWREVLWEWDTDLCWKHCIIIQLRFNPGHKVVDIFSGWYFQRGLDILTISPKIFVSGKKKRRLRRGNSGKSFTWVQRTWWDKYRGNRIP